MRIDVYCTGYKMTNPVVVLWGAILVATHEDGREIRSTHVGVLDSFTTKNVADLHAVIQALSCVKPQFRESTEVTLHTPPGYAYQMLERNLDNTWTAAPRSNLTEVETLRFMSEKYSKLNLTRGVIGSNIYSEMLSLIRGKVPNADLAGTRDRNLEPSVPSGIGAGVPSPLEERIA